MKAKGISMPDGVFVGNDFADEIGVDGGVALMQNGLLVLNPAAPYWDNPAREIAKQARLGHWSTDNPLHPLYHEAGHWELLHNLKEATRERLKREPPTGETEKRMRKVGTYALTNMEELVCEVYAQYLAGKEVPEDVKELRTVQKINFIVNLSCC